MRLTWLFLLVSLSVFSQGIPCILYPPGFEPADCYAPPQPFGPEPLGGGGSTNDSCFCDTTTNIWVYSDVWWDSGTVTNKVFGTDNLTNSFQEIIELDNGETNCWFIGTNCNYFFRVQGL